MNGDSAEQSPGPWSSTGLSRSYSEHAALVLEHFERHRDEPKHSRSGPEIRIDCRYGDDEDDAVSESHDGQRTWRISCSPSEDERQCHRKMLQFNSGDSNTLSTDFSELSLDQRQNPKLSVHKAPRITGTTRDISRRYQLYNGNETDGDDDRYTSVDDEEDERLRDDEPRSHSRPMHEVEAANSWSTTSLSSNRRRINGKVLSRNISYEDWAREKREKLLQQQEEERRIEERKREAEERKAREREAQERREHESFLGWLQQKQREQQLKRQLLTKEMELQNQLIKLEESAKNDKDVHLKQWCKKKEELMKATEKAELLRKKRAEEEKERRIQESTRAYEKWREKAKHASRPATQGLLPHQKAKPAFTNPKPWQPLIENVSDESDNSIPVTTSIVSRKNQRSKGTSTRR